MKILVVLLALVIQGCGPERSDLTGRWVVSIPYGWQDVYLNDNRIELQLNDDGTYAETHSWAGGVEVSRGRWRLDDAPARVVLQPNGPAQPYAYEVHGVFGARLLFSAGPDEPSLWFRRGSD